MDIMDRFEGMVSGRDAVVVECGCCDGYHTRLLTERGRKSARSYRHIAVEPVPRLVKISTEHCKSLGVTFIHGAVCETEDPIELWVSSGKDYYGSSSVCKPKDVTSVWPEMKFAEKITVPGITLDVLCRDLKVIDFIWADVQGAELRMIAGGHEALKKTRYLYTEYSGGGLYEGDATSAMIIEALGPTWAVEEDYGGDILMRNKAMEGEPSSVGPIGSGA